MTPSLQAGYLTWNKDEKYYVRKWYICALLQVAIIGLYYFITLQFAYSLGFQRTRRGWVTETLAGQIRHKNKNEERGG